MPFSGGSQVILCNILKPFFSTTGFTFCLRKRSHLFFSIPSADSSFSNVWVGQKRHAMVSFKGIYFENTGRKSLLCAVASPRSRVVLGTFGFSVSTRFPDRSCPSSLALTSHGGFATMSNTHKQRELMASPRHNDKHRRVLLLIL